MDSVDNLRTIARWVLILAIVVAGMVIFMGLPMFSIGSADEAVEGAGSAPVMDEEEVLLEEYLGLSDEEALMEAQDEPDDEDSEEGHA